MNRPSFDDYFLEIARVVATRGTCPRLQVGAVAVRDRRILATGYNGASSGMPHCDEVGCDIVDGHCRRTIHAEINLFRAATLHRIALGGATLYVTHQPCASCFNTLATSFHIREVRYRLPYGNNIEKMAKTLHVNIQCIE